MNDTFTNDELQILNILANKGLQLINTQYGYFKDAWFTHEQVVKLVDKLDKIDEVIRVEN